jgi:hypothetical protein
MQMGPKKTKQKKNKKQSQIFQLLKYSGKWCMINHVVAHTVLRANFFYPRRCNSTGGRVTENSKWATVLCDQ